MDTAGFYRLDTKYEALILMLIGSKQNPPQHSPPLQSTAPALEVSAELLISARRIKPCCFLLLLLQKTAGPLLGTLGRV